MLPIIFLSFFVGGQICESFLRSELTVIAYFITFLHSFIGKSKRTPLLQLFDDKDQSFRNRKFLPSKSFSEYELECHPVMSYLVKYYLQ